MEKKCKICGIVFDGNTNAQYCPSCRREVNNTLHRELYYKRKNGLTRKIGSTDICAKCGAEYTVTGSRQKFCPDCNSNPPEMILWKRLVTEKEKIAILELLAKLREKI